MRNMSPALVSGRSGTCATAPLGGISKQIFDECSSALAFQIIESPSRQRQMQHQVDRPKCGRHTGGVGATRRHSGDTPDEIPFKIVTFHKFMAQCKSVTI